MAPDSRGDPVADAAAAVVARLGMQLSTLAGSVHGLLVTSVPELRDDPQLLQLLHDSIEANIETLLSAIRHGILIENVKPPTAALEHARRLAQREISVNVLVRAYRLGHKALLDVVRDEVQAANLEAQLSLDVFGQIADVTFGYIDWISQEVIRTYQSEHDLWMEKRNSIRALRVREVLDSTTIDVDVMATEIRYPLRRTHLAAVLWWRESVEGDELTLLARFVEQLGRAADARATPLFIPVDRLTAWAWIPVTTAAAPQAVAQIRAAVERSAEAPRIAVGEPLADVDGFRQSHRQALAAHAVATASGVDAHRFTAASDPGLSLAALLGGDLAAAAEWVGQVLGPLAARTENNERLRETLRIFLRSGSSFTAAADELHLHYNSVKYRVRRALQRRGRPLTDDRLDVEVALALCHWYGDGVLG